MLMKATAAQSPSAKIRGHKQLESNSICEVILNSKIPCVIKHGESNSTEWNLIYDTITKLTKIWPKPFGRNNWLVPISTFYDVQKYKQ